MDRHRQTRRGLLLVCRGGHHQRRSGVLRPRFWPPLWRRTSRVKGRQL